MTFENPNNLDYFKYKAELRNQIALKEEAKFNELEAQR
jgi:hypothetical protein